MVNRLSVALTVEQCWQPVPGGSGVYVAELTRALAALGSIDVVGISAHHGAGDRPSPAPTGPVVASRLPRRPLYEAWSRLRVRAPRTGADVVHATTWAVPGATAPLVVTVHDLAFLRDPDHFTAHGVAYFRRNLDIVRAEAAAVVVPSRATRDDCVAAGIAASRLHVVPHGVRAAATSPSDVARWRTAHGLDGPYVLWCGTREPRKNAARLVRAFLRAREEGLDGRTLALVGPAGWGGTADEVDGLVAAAPAGAVRVLGRLDDDDLQLAYAGAEMFAFPSLWEGFGLPVVEAMAHGVPVVTSAGTAMAELTEGAGVLVDPLDVDAIAQGLLDLAAAPPARAAVKARGLSFTWESSARAHVQVYEDARAASVG